MPKTKVDMKAIAKHRATQKAATKSAMGALSKPDSKRVKAMQAQLRKARSEALQTQQTTVDGVTLATILGMKATQVVDLPTVVAQGLPYKVLDSLAEMLHFTVREFAEGFMGFTRPTLNRRKKAGVLTQPESDAAVRYARLLKQATDMMEGDEEAALRWLKAPLPILGDESPIAHARTEAGGREVELLIGRIEHGVYS